MNIETLLLNRLKNEQASMALAALLKPVDKSEFGYGFQSGRIAGLQHAIDCLLSAVDEIENGRKDI